jgi:Retrotransposon gag protein
MDAATQQVIAQLQQQLQTQQAQLQQQAQQQQQLYAQLAQQASSPSPPAVSSLSQGGKSFVRPKPPSTFAASDKVGELDQWEREMRYQFAAYGAAMAGEQARIAFAVSYLGAVPLQWWDANPAHQQVQTWTEFVGLLHARFRPVHAAKQARTELFKIKQAASQSAGAYAAAFQQLLVSLPDMHVDDQVFLFVRGLLPSLKRRVGDREFATLSAAINAAVQSEGLYGLQVGDDAPPSSSRTATFAEGSCSDMDLHAVSDDGHGQKARDAFQIGSMAARLIDLQEQLYALRTQQERPGWVPGLTPKQVADRRAAGACLRCGLQGHFKDSCPGGRK